MAVVKSKRGGRRKYDRSKHPWHEPNSPSLIKRGLHDAEEWKRGTLLMVDKIKRSGTTKLPKRLTK
jgi:hypothetical protein